VSELLRARNFWHRGGTSDLAEMTKKQNSKTEVKLPILYESKVKLRG
jgi:hypothetical protein